MANTRGGEIDAVTEEEISGTAKPVSASKRKNKEPGNAFTELMSPKKPKPIPGAKPVISYHQSAPRLLNDDDQRALNVTHGRGALAAYTRSPESFPPSRVISYDDDFAVIHDLYAKSSIHLLLLPRDRSKQRLHPFDAFDGSDPAFLESVRAKVAEVKLLAASELRRRFGKDSASDAPRLAALDADDPPEEADLPAGRDWGASILSGVHASPSMSHLHIHIISADRVSPAMKHRKHYNSFATPFLVPVDDMPLAADDPRRHPGRAGYLNGGMNCWRCGRGFGTKFEKLKRHLEEEFEVWKKE